MTRICRGRAAHSLGSLDLVLCCKLHFRRRERRQCGVCIFPGSEEVLVGPSGGCLVTLHGARASQAELGLGIVLESIGDGCPFMKGDLAKCFGGTASIMQVQIGKTAEILL